MSFLPPRFFSFSQFIFIKYIQSISTVIELACGEYGEEQLKTLIIGSDNGRKEQWFENPQALKDAKALRGIIIFVKCITVNLIHVYEYAIILWLNVHSIASIKEAKKGRFEFWVTGYAVDLSNRCFIEKRFLNMQEGSGKNIRENIPSFRYRNFIDKKPWFVRKNSLKSLVRCRRWLIFVS